MLTRTFKLILGYFCSKQKDDDDDFLKKEQDVNWLTPIHTGYNKSELGKQT